MPPGRVMGNLLVSGCNQRFPAQLPPASPYSPRVKFASLDLSSPGLGWVRRGKLLSGGRRPAGEESVVSNKAKIGAADLGIDLSNGADEAVFQWLIACQLFGERISQEIAAKTFTELDKAGYTTPKKLADADWQSLVDVLGRGGYRRYDESTARELISIGKYILEKYNGSMRKLRDDAGGTKKGITSRIEEFKGVG